MPPYQREFFMGLFKMKWSEWCVGNFRRDAGAVGNACLGIVYCFVPTQSVKTTWASTAVKLHSSASQHLWMTSSLASQKQSAEFIDQTWASAIYCRCAERKGPFNYKIKQSSAGCILYSPATTSVQIIHCLLALISDGKITPFGERHQQWH